MGTKKKDKTRQSGGSGAVVFFVSFPFSLFSFILLLFIIILLFYYLLFDFSRFQSMYRTIGLTNSFDLSPQVLVSHPFAYVPTGGDFPS